MASIPQFYCDYSSYSSDFSHFSYPNSCGETNTCGGDHHYHHHAVSSGAVSSSNDAISIASNNSGSIWGTSCTITDQESFPIISNFDILPPESDVVVSPSPAIMSSFPEQLGVLDFVGPSTLPDYNMALSGMQNFGGGGGGVCSCEFGDHDHQYSCGFVQDLKPVNYSSATAENWGSQNNGMSSMEDTITKVGRYSVEERKDRILRYLKKKNQRNFNKTIKYECRKTLADRRVRVRGRFARNSELCEEEIVMKNNNGNPQKENELYCTTDAFQMKQDEDQWLQEAMASLMYLPYITG
ncbi:hypothetical protein QYF36_006394 [Acer negundo]|nr:hypothetical protein QYF36_006394 [Acer negundo]